MMTTSIRLIVSTFQNCPIINREIWGEMRHRLRLLFEKSWAAAVAEAIRRLVEKGLKGA